MHVSYLRTKIALSCVAQAVERLYVSCMRHGRSHTKSSILRTWPDRAQPAVPALVDNQPSGCAGVGAAVEARVPRWTRRGR